MLTLVHPATSDGTIISWCGKTSHVDNKMLLCFQPLYDYVTSQGRKQTTDANPDFHGMADRVSSRLRRHGCIHPHISQAASHVLHVPQQKVSAVLTYLSSVLRDCFTCLWIVSFSQTYFFQAVTWKSFYSWFSYTCILIITSWKKCVNSLCLFSGEIWHWLYESLPLTWMFNLHPSRLLRAGWSVPKTSAHSSATGAVSAVCGAWRSASSTSVPVPTQL